ncbi:MAG: alpha-1,4-glucan--maltose-1-phosphate maltosyltransferase [Thermoleophilia bacterium]|nr:alpha-1,4-glucan--maltose-1-phosphate maltosyltransferase [Thermoleophilia bacterium]
MEAPMPRPVTGEPRARIRITDVEPQVDCGRHPTKATVGDAVRVSATVFRDGHEQLRAAVRWKPPGSRRWLEAPLEALGNDRYAGAFAVDAQGRWRFRVEAWRDRVASFQDELRRKVAAGQEDLAGELSEGAALLGVETLIVEEALGAPAGDRSELARSPELELDVGRPLARFGSWYELFPRSWGGFAGVERVLPELAELGFDVVYLPPIHPIGRTNRKGRNNTLGAGPNDPGSPWAIGAEEGGHDAVDPELGTLADFDRLVRRANELGLEIALDLAIQCSPDHPWLREHPEWFQRRPDGTIKYAENPPKKYQDIHNVDWDTDDRDRLWQALRDVVAHWVAHGVRVFRVDNPHTKPLPFWEWLIDELRRVEPDVLFLAEAFTRPAMMQALGKIGFDQSYTYFTWKNTRAELEEFMRDVVAWSPYYRPNFFANTPDILHEYLQRGGRPAFEARLVLAATLSPTYGIYSGYEWLENVPVREGSEEYLDSEKYEVKQRTLDGAPLLPLIARANWLRRENPALQWVDNLRFLETESDALLAYAKRSEANVLLCVVNLDPFAAREGLAIVPASLGLPPAFPVRDLLADEPHVWHTGRNYVRLDPGQSHVMRVGG